MSVMTNVLTKMKQYWYNTGANSEVVATGVDAMHGCVLNVRIPNGSDGNTAAAAADGSVVITTPFDSRLMTAYFTPAVTITEGTGDDVLITVTVNGVTAATYNSNTSAQGTANANTGMALSMTTVNSYLDAGEVCLVAYSAATIANAYADGILTLNFYRV